MKHSPVSLFFEKQETGLCPGLISMTSSQLEGHQLRLICDIMYWELHINGNMASLFFTVSYKSGSGLCPKLYTSEGHWDENVILNIGKVY